MNPGSSRSDAAAPTVSVVVPVYDAAGEIEAVLKPLLDGEPAPAEIIVADDASTDNTAELARSLGAKVVSLPQNAGPAAARNRGAEAATGDIVLFIDADVIPRSDTVARVVRHFVDDPELVALIGSYDDSPAAPSMVSRYRNLLHHYTHQVGSPDAQTFWGACGAVRRDVFLQLSGFDAERYRYPSVEDIDLGLRMTRAGHRIRLDRDLQVTHLKRWTLASMVHTDIFRRAVPWTRLMLAGEGVPDDLNTQWSRRMAALGAMVIVGGLILALFHSAALLLAGIGLVVMLVADRAVFGVFRRRYGLFFALACVPLQLLFYLYSTLAFVVTAVFGKKVEKDA